MVNIDGYEVAPGTANAFFQMREAFGQQFPGCVLLVSDGLRTMQQQQALWEAYQNGTGNLAAYPDPSAPHIRGVALDLRDSWNSPGVATGWNDRADWLRSNCGQWGFAATGYGFSSVEPWHYEYQGDPWNGTTPASGGADVGENITSRSVEAIQRLVGAHPDNVLGPDTTAKMKVWQSNHGLDPDGVWGPKSDAIGFPQDLRLDVDGGEGFFTTVKEQHVLGVHVDGVRGPETIRAEQALTGVPPDRRDSVDGPDTATHLQRYLHGLGYGGIVGDIDGDRGPRTVKGLQTSLNDGRFGQEVTYVPPGVEEPAEVGENITFRPVGEIQRLVGAQETGVYDAQTTAKVKVWQAANRLEPDGIWGNASDGRGFPAVPEWEGVDYSFARPAPADLYGAGFSHVGRYLWPNTKGLTRDEYDALTVAGLAVWLIYEEDGRELLGGFDAGVRAARRSEELRVALRLGPQPIYFNVDFDASDAELATILAALDGVASVIGLERTGLYGGYRPIRAAFDAGKIRWGFQTYAWSGGQWDARAQLQQYANGQWGGQVDFTRATAAEFGQNPVVDLPTPTPEPTPEPEPEPTPIPEPEPEPTPVPEPEPPKGYPVPTPPNVPSDALSKLNSILPAKVRDWLYITYALLGVAATGFTGYLTSVQALAPEWFVGGLATYAAIGPFVAIIAKANLNEE